MNKTEQVMSFVLPTYNHSLAHLDTKRHALWHYLNPTPRPIITHVVLTEILDLQERVRQHLLTPCEGALDIQYMVLASAIPEVFCLGGDLQLFSALIRARNRNGLIAYGRACIDSVYNCATHLGNPDLTTIALVQGSALGGGFEAVLANNVLVAERSALFGLPEILFNLFPGMGAYSLLARRLGMARAERFLSSGRQYSAAEMYEMGIVDVLAENGKGVLAVNAYIRKHSRARNGLLAIQRVRDRLAPINYQELDDVMMIWVETAMTIDERDLRTMERLVSAQRRLSRRLDQVVMIPREVDSYISYSSAAL